MEIAFSTGQRDALRTRGRCCQIALSVLCSWRGDGMKSVLVAGKIKQRTVCNRPVLPFMAGVPAMQLAVRSLCPRSLSWVYHSKQTFMQHDPGTGGAKTSYSCHPLLTRCLTDSRFMGGRVDWTASRRVQALEREALDSQSWYGQARRNLPSDGLTLCQTSGASRKIFQMLNAKFPLKDFRFSAGARYPTGSISLTFLPATAV